MHQTGILQDGGQKETLKQHQVGFFLNTAIDINCSGFLLINVFYF